MRMAVGPHAALGEARIELVEDRGVDERVELAGEERAAPRERVAVLHRQHPGAGRPGAPSSGNACSSWMTRCSCCAPSPAACGTTTTSPCSPLPRRRSGGSRRASRGTSSSPTDDAGNGRGGARETRRPRSSGARGSDRAHDRRHHVPREPAGAGRRRTPARSSSSRSRSACRRSSPSWPGLPPRPRRPPFRLSLSSSAPPGAARATLLLPPPDLRSLCIVLEAR